MVNGCVDRFLRVSRRTGMGRVGEHLLFDGTDTFHSPWRSVAMPESLGLYVVELGHYSVLQRYYLRIFTKLCG